MATRKRCKPSRCVFSGAKPSRRNHGATVMKPKIDRKKTISKAWMSAEIGLTKPWAIENPTVEASDSPIPRKLRWRRGVMSGDRSDKGVTRFWLGSR